MKYFVTDKHRHSTRANSKVSDLSKPELMRTATWYIYVLLYLKLVVPHIITMALNWHLYPQTCVGCKGRGVSTIEFLYISCLWTIEIILTCTIQIGFDLCARLPCEHLRQSKVRWAKSSSRLQHHLTVTIELLLCVCGVYCVCITTGWIILNVVFHIATFLTQI